MKKIIKIYLLLLLSFHFAAGASGKKTDSALTDSLIPFDAESASSELFESENNRDFFKLASFFESQSNSIYCGPATATILLNAFRPRK